MTYLFISLRFTSRTRQHPRRCCVKRRQRRAWRNKAINVWELSQKMTELPAPNVAGIVNRRISFRFFLRTEVALFTTELLVSNRPADLDLDLISWRISRWIELAVRLDDRAVLVGSVEDSLFPEDAKGSGVRDIATNEVMNQVGERGIP